MDFKEGEVLFFDKPLGWTSFDLVNRIRRMVCRHIQEKKLKVGHAGTLDPLATGVTIVCTGKKTKDIDQYQYQTKEYVAEVRLGATTPSFDLEHPIDAYFPTDHITESLILSVLPQFQGEIWQTPPTYSAVKVDGKRAYDYARQGLEVDIRPKLLVIDEIELVRFVKETMTMSLRIVCSKGTYIRAMARDLGRALGTGAHLTALQRIRIGNVSLVDCITIEQFTNRLETNMF